MYSSIYQFPPGYKVIPELSTAAPPTMLRLILAVEVFVITNPLRLAFAAKAEADVTPTDVAVGEEGVNATLVETSISPL